MSGNAILNEDYSALYQGDNLIQTTQTFTIDPGEYELEVYLASKNNPNLKTDRDIQITVTDEGEGYIINDSTLDLSIPFQDLYLEWTELDTSIKIGTLKALSIDNPSGNLLTWTLQGNAEDHKLSTLPFNVGTDNIQTTDNLIYFQAGQTESIALVQVYDGTELIKSSNLTIFSGSEENFELELEFPVIFESEADYRLIQLPLYHKLFDDIEETLLPLLGEMDEYSYLLYGFDPSLEEYLLADDPDISIGMGRSFWIGVAVGGELTIEGIGVGTDNLIQIELSEGWQMIGNPYLTTLQVKRHCLPRIW